MKKINYSKLNISILAILIIAFCVSCDKKSTEPSEEHELEITMEYEPNPATVGTEITITFEVEEDGEHINVGMTSCKIGGHDGEDLELTSDDDDPGHYIGTHTFEEAGQYELHFSYMHDDGDMADKEFEIEIVE